MCTHAHIVLQVLRTCEGSQYTPKRVNEPFHRMEFVFPQVGWFFSYLNCSSKSYPRAGSVLTIVDRSHCTRVPPRLVASRFPRSPRRRYLSSGLPPSFVLSRFLLSFLPVLLRGPFCIPCLPPSSLSRRSLGPRLSFSSAYAHLKCVYTPSLASSFVKRARVVVLARSVKI